MRTRYVLLAAALFAGDAAIAIAQNAGAHAPGYDPSQLPAIEGKVAQYSPTPRGDVDGLILIDGTQVHSPPHLGTRLVFAVKPSDAVTVRGLRARAIPMVQAISVSNDATGDTVTDNAGGPGPRGVGQTLTAEGRIKAQLHGPLGDLNGAPLEDGTIVHLPPPEAHRLAAELTPGGPPYVQGDGFAGPLGRVIEATSIGPNRDELAQIAAPPPPPGPGRRPPPPGREPG
jgi:hypothetical protein